MKFVDLNSKKIDLNMSWHGNVRGFRREVFLKNYKKYSEKFDPTICSTCDIGDDAKFFKRVHYQNILDGNVPVSEISGPSEKDLFYFNGNNVTESWISKNKISFKGWNCEMYNFQLDKTGITDECNGKHYSFGDDLKITRICDKESCFKNGDFLLYNKKYKNK